MIKKLLKFVLFKIINVSCAENNGAKVGVWGKEDILRSLNIAQKMLPSVLVNLELYLSRPYPLPELNLVALPGYTDDKPIDAWGLQMFREVDLSKKRDDYWVAYTLAKHASLQWTEHLTTPLFPTSLTMALSKFLADKVAWQVRPFSVFNIMASGLKYLGAQYSIVLV